MGAAQTISQPLHQFTKLHAGPYINVVLQEGENEHIRIEYSGIAPEKINYLVKRKKLSIYLDDAKYTVKTEKVLEDGYERRVSVYQGVQITAYVTYARLKSIQKCGEEKVTCEDPLVSKKFKIRMFGESKLQLASLYAGRLKVQLFGDNSLTIRNGESFEQRYRLFGDNTVDTEKMEGFKISTSLFGDNRLNLYASDEISLWGIGEVKLQYSGDPRLSRFVLGEATINSR